MYAGKQGSNPIIYGLTSISGQNIYQLCTIYIISEFIIIVTTGELQSSKRPELNNVYTLLKGKCADWDTIGRALGVSLDKRKSLEKNGSYDNSRRLEEVLYIWLETSEQSNVTWEEFIRILKDELGYNDIVKKTEQFLLK